jgi:hypothetical protein
MAATTLINSWPRSEGVDDVARHLHNSSSRVAREQFITLFLGLLEPGRTALLRECRTRTALLLRPGKVESLEPPGSHRLLER